MPPFSGLSETGAKSVEKITPGLAELAKKGRKQRGKIKTKRPPKKIDKNKEQQVANQRIRDAHPMALAFYGSGAKFEQSSNTINKIHYKLTKSQLNQVKTL